VSVVARRERRERGEFAAHYARTASATHATGDEFQARADAIEEAMYGHPCGHLWTIDVTCVGHYSVTGDPEHRDAPDAHRHHPVQVRAHDLRSALRKAAALPLSEWFDDEEVAHG
jgi:hypothetical protein